ncbi:MAG: GAF domain-containing protein [Elusimicrobiota bacterium]|jgi:adenylate cyclase
MLGTYHLTSLFDILNKIHFVYDPVKLWDFILEQACKTLQSEAGTYYEVLEDEQTLRVAAAYGIDVKRLDQVPFRVGSGISGWVAQYHQPALVSDVRQDNRFNRHVDMMTGFQTKSILCIPVFSQKRTYGVIEIINRKSGQFNPQDQEFMTLLGRQVAIAYQNLLLIQEVQNKEVLLESLLANLSGGLIAIDATQTITILNPSATQLLRLDGQPSVGKPVNVILKDYPWFIETLQQTFTNRNTVSRQETKIPINGEDQRIGYTTILISDKQQQILGSGIIFQKLSS